MISIFALSPTKFQVFELILLLLTINISLHLTDAADSTTQAATSTASTSSISASAVYDVSTPSLSSDMTKSQIIQIAIGVSVTILIVCICALYCYLYGKRNRRIHSFLSPTPPRNAFSESAKRLEESSSETRKRFYAGEVDRLSSARPSLDNPTGVGSNVSGGGGDGTITAVVGQNIGIGNSSLASVNLASEYNAGSTLSLSSIELQANPIEVN